MNRHLFFVMLIPFLPSIGFGAQQPNVIFVFADDLGYGDLNCHRDSAFQNAPDQPNGRIRRSDEWRGKVLTPNLDRLAREGTDFQQFMVCSPVCAPSRVAAMTGHFPSRHKVHHIFTDHNENTRRGMPDWLAVSAPMLPRRLKRIGYRTGHFGKWHLGHGDGSPKPSEYGIDRGAFYAGQEPHVFEGTPYKDEQGDAHGEVSASLLSVAATDHAVSFIREVKDDPFYVNLWLHETHHVVSARKEDRIGYEDVPEPYQTYYAAVKRLDSQVGRILDLLDELNLSKNTLVIFSSDNGPENHSERLNRSVGSPAGMRGRKRSLMMGGLNVPFICRWPDVIPAGRIDKTSSLSAVDLMPTILSATGAPVPKNYESDGEDIIAALRGDAFKRTKPLFWFWMGNHGGDNWPVLAVRQNNYAMVVDPSRNRTELYDVVNDRFQTNDLSGEMPEFVESLMAQIDAWVEMLPPLPPIDIQQRIAASKVKNSTKASGKPIDRAAVFLRKDKNADGYLSLEEYGRGLLGSMPIEIRFLNFDSNRDGKISQHEFTRR